VCVVCVRYACVCCVCVVCELCVVCCVCTGILKFLSARASLTGKSNIPVCVQGRNGVSTLSEL